MQKYQKRMTNTMRNDFYYMKQLQDEIKEFIRRRHWHPYHSPKNLAMALCVESAELMEIFQWMTEEESREVSPAVLEHIEEEIGDVMIYLCTLAAAFGLDPLTAARRKLIKNGRKYPETPSASDDRDLT